MEGSPIEAPRAQPPVEKRDILLYIGRSDSVLEIHGRNVEYIFVDYMIGDRTWYYINYVVKAASWLLSRPSKTTRMIKKRKCWLVGEVIDIEWKGEGLLAAALNSDWGLRQKLLRSRYVGGLMRGIWIYPRQRYGYYKIRTWDYLPELDFFETLDTIARHLKSCSSR
ncbi:MAG: hypothetical protein HY673_04295 [Chloroflexi bacterium]|nr:hypothetical protein [Chloroflexota bacterium]